MSLRLQTTTCTTTTASATPSLADLPGARGAYGNRQPAHCGATTGTARGDSTAADPRPTTASASWDTFNRPAYIHGWAVSSAEVDSLDAEAWQEGTSESCNHVNHIWARKRNFNAMIERFDIEHPDGWDKLGTAAGYSGPPLVYESIDYDPATHDPATSPCSLPRASAYAPRAYASPSKRASASR